MEIGFLGPHPKPVWSKGEFSKESRTMSIKTGDGAFAVILKANQGEGRTPDGVKFTPKNTKVDVEIDYSKFKDLKDGNFIGLDTYVISTEAKAGAAVKAGKGVYIEQIDNHPTLGFAWDAKATVEAVGEEAEVKASALVGASIDDIQPKDMLIHAMGAAAQADAGAKLSCEKVTFTFKTSKAGKLVWDPVVGIGSPEDQDLIPVVGIGSPEDQDLISGAGGSARCIIMLLAILVPAMVALL